MSVKATIDRVKAAYDAVKDDKEVQAVWKEAKDILEKLIKKDDKALDVQLTGYEDVDETLKLVRDGQKMREVYARRSRALNLIMSIGRLAMQYAPVVKEVVKAAKKRSTSKGAATKASARRKKK